MPTDLNEILDRDGLTVSAVTIDRSIRDPPLERHPTRGAPPRGRTSASQIPLGHRGAPASGDKHRPQRRHG